MRILFFTDTLDVGGKERRLTELIKALLRKGGTDFELVVMSSEIHYREILELGIKIHYITRNTRHDISIFRKFHALCRLYKPDIIHCWDSMTAVYLVPVCRLLGIKLINGMVVDAPSKQNLSNKYYLRAKLTFPFSDVIVGNSEAGLRAYKAPLRKSVVIHNGFDFRRIMNLKDRDEIVHELQAGNRLLVGMVASFGPYKDYPTYYQAAQAILFKRDDVLFVAIGNRTDSDESRNIIAAECREGFRLLGRRHDPESYINALDVCILSTFTEGISNSIMEYMALGKPVIATDGGGTCEIVSNGTTGFLVDQSDPAGLAEKIGQLLDDKDLRTRMGEEGRKRVTDYFSINRMTDRYLDLYTNLRENGRIIHKNIEPDR